MTATPETFDLLTLAKFAAEEGIDRRTLQRRLRGEPVRGLAGARADRAVAKLRAAASNASSDERKGGMM
jgi:hypothetical protein